MPQYDSHKWDRRAEAASPYIIASVPALIVVLGILAFLR